MGSFYRRSSYPRCGLEPGLVGAQHPSSTNAPLRSASIISVYNLIYNKYINFLPHYSQPSKIILSINLHPIINRYYSLPYHSYHTILFITENTNIQTISKIVFYTQLAYSFNKSLWIPFLIKFKIISSLSTDAPSKNGQNIN